MRRCVGSLRRALGGCILFVAAAELAGCADKTSGPGTVPQVAVGDTVSGSVLAVDATRMYSFVASADSVYAVFLQPQFPATISVQDPQGATVASTYADSGARLLDVVTPPFQARAAGTYTITLSPTTGNAVGYFRFFIYPVHTAPESRAARFALGDTVTGESLETIADVDRFVFAGQSGQEVIAYAQALGGDDGHRMVLTANAPGTPGVATLGGDTSLELQATGRFLLPTTGDYTITILGQPDGYYGIPAFEGPYRFQVRAVNTAPEHVPAAVALGDTVSGERIDYVGDIDEFPVSAAPGQRVNVFLQATGAASDSFTLAVRESADTAFTIRTTSGGADSGLFSRATGTFTVPSIGAAPLLRVQGVWDRYAVADRGPYRLLVYPIDTAPEHVGDSVALGDSVVGEAIDAPGDVDDYRMTLPAPALVNYVFRRGPPAAGGDLLLTVTGPDNIVVDDPTSVAASGVALRPAGRYVLQLAGASSADGGYYGPYRLSILRIDTLPEVAPESVAVGDTVTEPLEPMGDRDQFVFVDSAWHHLVVSTQMLTGSGAELALRAPSGTQLAYVPPGATSGRLDLTETGRYVISVVPNNNGADVSDTGTYRIILHPELGRPETAPDSLLAGDSVTTESLDYPGDLDQFTLIGTPGEELAMILEGNFAYGAQDMDVLDTATDSILADDRRVVGPTDRFLVPASGRALIRVFGEDSVTGPYTLWAYPIHLPPELVPDTVTLGDTVSGETIDPIEDVDEFTFSGTAGQTVTVLFDVPTGASFPGYQLQFVDPATDSVLGTATAFNPSTTFGDINTGPITLPRTGSYMIRVESVDYTSLADRPYRFLVR